VTVASDLPPELDRQAGGSRSDRNMADRDTADGDGNRAHADRDTADGDRNPSHADRHPGELPAELARFAAAQRATAPPPRQRSRLDQRRDAIRTEIERNRRGEYKVPTWVFGAVLVLIVAGFVAFAVFG